MNTNDKSEISEYLEPFQKRLKATKNAAVKLAATQKDLAELHAQLAAIGTPSYKDTEPFTNQVVLERKIKVCEAEVETQRGKLGENTAELAEAIARGAVLAMGIVKELYQVRLKAVTRVLLPFSSNERSAELVARQVDACRAAWSRHDHFEQLPRRIRRFSGKRFGETESHAQYATEAGMIIKYADQLDGLLGEAVSKAPNLMRFISFAGVDADGANSAKAEEAKA